MPGSLVSIRRGETLGEVVIEAKTYRATKIGCVRDRWRRWWNCFRDVEQSISAEFQ